MKRITEKYLVETAKEGFFASNEKEKKRLIEMLGKDKATIDIICGNDWRTTEKCEICRMRYSQGVKTKEIFICDFCIVEMAALL